MFGVRHKARQLALIIAVVAVIAAALPSIIEASGPKEHDPGATASVDGGTTAAIAITIKNTSTSGNITAQGIRVYLDADLAASNVVSVTKAAGTAGTITPYALPNGTLGSATPYIEILNANVTRNSTYTFTINARIPCATQGTAYDWRTDIRQSNDFNGTNNKLPVVSPDPTPAVTTVASNCSLAFTAQPKNALPGQTITNVAFDATAATKVKVAVKSGGASPVTVTWFSGTINLAFDPAATTSAGDLSKDLPADGAGEVTFGDLSITAPTGNYRLKASTTGLADVFSDSFTVDNGVTVTCTAGNSPICTTGPIPGQTAGTTGVVTVNDNDTLNATLTARWVTNDIDCAGYTEFGDRLFFDVQTTGSLSGLTKTVTVTKPIPAGLPSGPGEEWRYQVCFQSRDQFAAIAYSTNAQANFDTLLKALSGGNVTSPAELVPEDARVIGDKSADEYRGLLPQCSLVNGVAPCVDGPPTFANGNVTFTGKVPAADPVWK
jgi:hypothetical protein